MVCAGRRVLLVKGAIPQLSWPNIHLSFRGYFPNLEIEELLRVVVVTLVGVGIAEAVVAHCEEASEGFWIIKLGEAYTSQHVVVLSGVDVCGCW